MHMNLDTDFSSINYQYLLKVRDIAKQEPTLVMDIRPKKYPNWHRFSLRQPWLISTTRMRL